MNCDDREVEIKVMLRPVNGRKAFSLFWILGLAWRLQTFQEREHRQEPQREPHCLLNQPKKCSVIGENFVKRVQILNNNGAGGKNCNFCQNMNWYFNWFLHLLLQRHCIHVLPHTSDFNFNSGIWILIQVICYETILCSTHCDFPEQFVTFHPCQ